MSKVAIQGNASGTGVFTLASPNSNTDRTLTLPDAAGTMMLTDTGVTTAQMPAGSVLQVVYANNTTQTDITSSTYTTIVTATITPSSTSSKILILANIAAVSRIANGAEGEYQVFRNGSGLGIMDGVTPWNGSTSTRTVGSVSAQYFDSPSSTSLLTYTLQMKDGNAYGIRINFEGGVTSLTLMEIAA